MNHPQPTPPDANRPPDPDDLRREAHRSLDDLLDFAQAAQPCSLLQFEADLRLRVFALGLLALRLFFLALHARLDLAPWRDRGYRVADPYATRDLDTSLGTLTFGRAYLKPARGDGPGVHPVDVAAGLSRDLHSPFLIGWFARLSARLSFRLASTLGGLVVACRPAPTTVEGWVLGLGRSAYAFLTEGPLPDGDGEVLVIECDGKAVPTATARELKRRRRPRKAGRGCGCKGCQRHRGRCRRKRWGKRARRKPGDRSKNGRSAVLVVLYTLKRGADGRLHGPVNKKVFGTFSCRRAALEVARKQATRRGFPPGTEKTVQVVVDGEECLAAGLRTLFPGAILTLDVRHAQERLWQAGRALHRAGSEGLAAWVEPLEALLYAGKTGELLTELRESRARVSLRGPGTAATRAVLDEVIEYLEKRVAMMDYREWRKADLVIASGVVEGAARYVVGERLDSAGMRWIAGRAECLLLLRCIEVNGDWEAFWAFAQERRSRDLEAGRVVRILSTTPTQVPVENPTKKKPATEAA